jgi:hypothetical protein
MRACCHIFLSSQFFPIFFGAMAVMALDPVPIGASFARRIAFARQAARLGQASGGFLLPNGRTTPDRSENEAL